MTTAIAKTEVWGGKGRSEQWNGGGVRENDFPLNQMYHNLPLHIGLEQGGMDKWLPTASETSIP